MRKKIRVLIVDDESLARKRISDLIVNRDGFEIVGECSNGTEAVSTIGKKSPDLVFLDIQMPDMNGFDVLEQLENRGSMKVVFVTAYDQFALKAFETHALDYLLKPFKDTRFDEMLEHVSNQIRQHKVEDLSEQLSSLVSEYATRGTRIETEHADRLIIKSTGKITFVKVEEIDWIGGEGPYVSLNVNGKAHLMRERLKALEESLDPKQFLRIHRSTIVNLSRVVEMRPTFNGEYVVILEGGKRLKLSRSYRHQLDRFFGA